MSGRMNSLYALGNLKNELDQLFSGVLESPLSRAFSSLWGEPGFPAVNVWEDEEGFHAEAELPGMKLEDLELYVVGSQLTIKGERKAERPAGSNVHRAERPAGAFSRVIRLPAEVDAEKVRATIKDGVLSLSLPKSESAKPRKISVVAK